MISKNNSKPKFSENEVKQHLNEFYNLQGILRSLPSYLDQNFLLTDIDNQQFVCKIANLEVNLENLKFQNQMIQHLYDKNKNAFPQLVPSINKIGITQIITSNGAKYYFRLISYISGYELAKYYPHTPEILTSLGEFIGELRNYLSDLEFNVKKKYIKWDLEYGIETISTYKSNIIENNKLIIIEYFQDLFNSEISTNLEGLEDGIIHGDANDYNLIIQDFVKHNESVTWSLIDFGDFMYSKKIFELAVSIAYAILDKANPISTIIDIVRGYNSKHQMDEKEKILLFPLICLRLCISVCISAYQKIRDPENEYISVSEKVAWNTLSILKDIPHKFAYYCIRWVCGLNAHPNFDSVISWCQKQDFFPIFGKQFEYEVIDLSIGSLDITGFVNADNLDTFNQLIIPRINKNKIIIGRYSESRLMYIHDKFSKDENEFSTWRVIHLGIDLFTNPRSEVFAPLSGEIVSIFDNQSKLDYGPTIILKHITNSGIVFYTLYGHLSRDSLKTSLIGTKIEAGTVIGKVGASTENGSWTPHVHIQIILDLLNDTNTFPGVSSFYEREIWKSICPDPNIILKYESIEFIDPQIEADTITNKRNHHISSALSVSYKPPLHIVRGYMQYLYSQDGRRYLDAANNVPIVGHSHPFIVEALYKQASLLNTNTRYLQENLSQYAEQLCSLFPSKLSIAFFVNSGSEANELAIRLAKTFTGNNNFIVVENAYHGNTNQIIDLSPYKFDNKVGKGKPDNVHVVSMPYSYRGKFQGIDVSRKYADEVSSILNSLKGQNRGIAAFIAESLPSVGGQIIFPKNYLKLVYEKIHEEGGVCIADEVQVGFARVGTHYWGFETQDVIPDIVTLGKSIGNGHPIGAVITTEKIAKAFENGMEFFTTTGGNTVSMAVGKAVLDVIKKEKLQDNAKDVGNYLLEELQEVQSYSNIIGDVRGWGLFVGIEIVKTKESKEPASEFCYYIVEQMNKKGVLVALDGPDNNVIKIKPPLIFNRKNVDELISKFKLILAHTYLQSPN